MTVAELIKDLKKFDPDTRVFIGSTDFSTYLSEFRINQDTARSEIDIKDEWVSCDFPVVILDYSDARAPVSTDDETG